MVWRLCSRLVCWMCFMVLVMNQSCIAQNSSLEFWPEVDIWYRLNPSWRFSSFVSVTKFNESKNRDLNIYLNADYAWGHTKHVIFRRLVDQEKEQEIKAWMVRAGFMEGKSFGGGDGNYAEELLFAEIHKRIPIKRDILLSHRFRMDSRWLGEDNDFSYRFRYRLMVEKEFKSGNSSIVPYLNVEPYWDSRFLKIAKIRAIGGVTTSWSSKYALEGNVTYQFDENYDTKNLCAFNVIFHVFLERAK